MKALHFCLLFLFLFHTACTQKAQEYFDINSSQTLEVKTIFSVDELADDFFEDFTYYGIAHSFFDKFIYFHEDLIVGSFLDTQINEFYDKNSKTLHVALCAQNNGIFGGWADGINIGISKHKNYEIGALKYPHMAKKRQRQSYHVVKDSYFDLFKGPVRYLYKEVLSKDLRNYYKMSPNKEDNIVFEKQLSGRFSGEKCQASALLNGGNQAVFVSNKYTYIYDTNTQKQLAKIKRKYFPDDNSKDSEFFIPTNSYEIGLVFSSASLNQIHENHFIDFFYYKKQKAIYVFQFDEQSQSFKKITLKLSCQICEELMEKHGLVIKAISKDLKYIYVEGLYTDKRKFVFEFE